MLSIAILHAGNYTDKYFCLSSYISIYILKKYKLNVNNLSS